VSLFSQFLDVNPLLILHNSSSRICSSGSDSETFMLQKKMAFTIPRNSDTKPISVNFHWRQ